MVIDRQFLKVTTGMIVKMGNLFFYLHKSYLLKYNKYHLEHYINTIKIKLKPNEIIRVKWFPLW